MAVTKTWEINTVERDLSDGYVTKVIYRVKGIDSSDSTEKARHTGEVTLAKNLNHYHQTSLLMTA